MLRLADPVFKAGIASGEARENGMRPLPRGIPLAYDGVQSRLVTMSRIFQKTAQATTARTALKTNR
jgi:hypothetical protein